ncbi:UDP-2,3-diacylglucosamine diphosphatase [Sulfurospirillum sp. 1612]|uniref:UDP-2,3-diacylglucosamine diphosphatase n=1 Tax=Sulfurospirillum sp. 1612 TaxID=3094835 RepID=UPI002F925062
MKTWACRLLHMCLDIKEGAIFISDAHDNDQRDYFWQFLQLIATKQIKTPQLFLMGDMFDLLVGEVQYLTEKYKKYIQLLEQLAREIDIYYLEGNHDFALKALFHHVHVYTIEEQPLIARILGQKVLLLHGDKYGSIWHRVYTKMIRNRLLLRVLNLCDVWCQSCISKKISNRLLQKNICTQIEGFPHIIDTKIQNFMTKETDFIAEGHYHQNKAFECHDIQYINFSSFACEQSYFVVQFNTDIKFIEKKLRGFDV